MYSKTFIQNNTYIGLHLVAWILFLLVPILFIAENRFDNIVKIIQHYQFWAFALYYVILFYVHKNYLLPHFFYHRKKYIYYSCVIIIIAVTLLYMPFDNVFSIIKQPFAPPINSNIPPPLNIQQFKPKPKPNHFDIISFILMILVLFMGIIIQTFQRLQTVAERAAKAELERTQAELSFLKANINPHFLFNTLNNIYALAVSNNQHTAESIMKLSNIMRYITDEASENFVPLQFEIDCITDYVDLQKLRLGSKTSVNFTVEGALEYHRIAPLLLITFIENMFKYGVSNHEASVLTANIKIQGTLLLFTCTNKIFEQKKPFERSGKGLDNALKRLEYLYPNKHKLTINQNNGLYTVILHIEM